MILDDLNHQIAKIEREISQTLDAILHHPRFQQLEARWAGVRKLVMTVPDDFIGLTGQEESRRRGDRSDQIVVSIWNVSKEELREDLEFAISIPRSAFHRFVYQEALNTAGGQPFGVLLGDYTFSDKPDDVDLLRRIAQVACDGFSPFIAAVDVELFGIDRFDELYRVIQSHKRQAPRKRLETLFDENRFQDWNELRSEPESRFLGLTLPRMLMRRPYDYQRSLGRNAEPDKESSLILEHPDDYDQQAYEAKQAESSQSRDGIRGRGRRWQRFIPAPFPYRESLVPPRSNENDNEKVSSDACYLWGSAIFAFGAVVIDAFARSGWLADIHGVPREPGRAGIDPRAVVDRFSTDSLGIATKQSTEVAISDFLEKELAEVGLMSLTHRQFTDHCAFCSTVSLHRPTEFDDPGKSLSERMSSLLHYVLCVSRFAHFLKQLGHDKVGSATSKVELEKVLDAFLAEYVLNRDYANPELKAQKPLRSAKVEVNSIPGETGGFHCDITLQPHRELDAVEIHLSTDMMLGN